MKPTCVYLIRWPGEGWSRMDRRGWVRARLMLRDDLRRGLPVFWEGVKFARARR